MNQVKHGEPPVNTFFQYKIDPPSEITIDLSLFNEKANHIMMIKNSIIYAIILFYKENKGRILRKINFQTDDMKQSLLISTYLPLIYNQSRFYNLTFSPTPNLKNGFVLNDDWAKQIVKNINFQLDSVKKKISDLKIQDSGKLMFYKTVSNSPLQIRYKGYQIGTWNSVKKEITAINQKDGESFPDFAKRLIETRSRLVQGQSEIYFEKEEHYLESILLEKILIDRLEIKGRQITKIFPNSAVSFQFPVLLKPGASTKDKKNSAKYIDILAKSGNRPVVMELKVWNEQRKRNSRGQYLFSAFSQVLGYVNYLVNVFGDQSDDFAHELKGLYELNWKKPIVYIIINDIGDDKRADDFRIYIRNIKRHIQNAELHFVEFEQFDWDENREFTIKSII